MQVDGEDIVLVNGQERQLVLVVKHVRHEKPQIKQLPFEDK